MNNITTYITEKLHISKGMKADLVFPVNVEFWSDWKDKGNLEDEMNGYINISYSNLKRINKEKQVYHSSSSPVRHGYLFEIEILKEHDLLWFLVYIYSCFSETENFTGTDFFKPYINNFDDIKDYIESFTNKEYQDTIYKYLGA